MGIGLVALMATVAWADCPSPAAHIDSAQQAVLEARLDDAATQLAAAEGAFGCDLVAKPELLARMWIAEGALMIFQGDEAAAAESFASARRVSPETWVDAYGSKLKSAWEKAPDLAGAGTITLEPATHPDIGFLDGVAVPFPAEASAGLHLVQVVPDGQAQFAAVVFLGAEDALTVQTDLPANLAPMASAIPTAPPPDASSDGASPPILLLAGVGLGVLALGAAGGAYIQNGAMKQAETMDELDGVYRTQKTFAYTTGALAVLSGAGFGLHFAL